MLPKKSGLEFEFSMEKEATPIPDDPPFKILMLGDYSARENRESVSGETLSNSKPIEVDRDNFEELLGSLNPRLRLNLQEDSDDTLLLSFSDLDDFHPDNLFKKVSLFSDLRDVRKRLLSSDTFDSAAEEIASWLETDSGAIKEIENIDPPDNAETGSGNLLDDILGDTKADASVYKKANREKSLLGDFVRDVVKPYLVETDEAEQAKMLALVDSATGDLMRTILHNPEFKALESAWRGLYFLVRGAETNSDLKIYLLDISKHELVSDLRAASDLSDSGLYRTLISETSGVPGGVPWAVICGNYEFSLDVEDTAALIRLAKLGNISSAPFISQIKPQMLGIDSIADASEESSWNYKDETKEGKLWTMLRTIPESASLGLATPRFLSRLPYGEMTDPTEGFDFEELIGEVDHDQYLWLNPSFAIALLFAQSFSANSWEMGSRLFQELEGLPTHLYKQDGETKTKPCAEVVLTHAACDVLIEQGLMPLISFKDSNRVRLGGFHSIAYPGKGLNGRWS